MSNWTNKKAAFSFPEQGYPGRMGKGGPLRSLRLDSRSGCWLPSMPDSGLGKHFAGISSLRAPRSPRGGWARTDAPLCRLPARRRCPALSQRPCPAPLDRTASNLSRVSRCLWARSVTSPRNLCLLLRLRPHPGPRVEAPREAQP